MCRIFVLQPGSHSNTQKDFFSNLKDLFVRGGLVGVCDASKVFLPSVRFHPNLDTGLNIRVNRITRDRKEEDGCFPGSACGRPVEGLAVPSIPRASELRQR